VLQSNVEVCGIDHGLFCDADGFEAQIEAFFAELKTFCSANGLQLHMTALTRTLLGFPKSSEYPVAMLCCCSECFYNSFWCRFLTV